MPTSSLLYTQLLQQPTQYEYPINPQHSRRFKIPKMSQINIQSSEEADSERRLQKKEKPRAPNLPLPEKQNTDLQNLTTYNNMNANSNQLTERTNIRVSDHDSSPEQDVVPLPHSPTNIVISSSSPQTRAATRMGKRADDEFCRRSSEETSIGGLPSTSAAQDAQIKTQRESVTAQGDAPRPFVSHNQMQLQRLQRTQLHNFKNYKRIKKIKNDKNLSTQNSIDSACVFGLSRVSYRSPLPTGNV